MLFRPDPCQWFEIYVPRERTVTVLEALANTGIVELESDPRLAHPLNLYRLRALIEEFRQLSAGHLELLEGGEHPPCTLLRPPEQVAEEVVAFLRQWRAAVDEILGRQRQLEQERSELLLLLEGLTALHGASADLPQLANPSDFLYKGVFACPSKRIRDSQLAAAVDQLIPGERFDFFLVADLPDKERLIEQAYENAACLRVTVPPWLSEDPSAQRDQVGLRLHEIDAELDRLAGQLRERRREPHLACALDYMRLLAWYAENADKVAEGASYCHVTGWVIGRRIPELGLALSGLGLNTRLRLTPPPDNRKPPVHLLLPCWARPFGLFIDMAGTPGGNEVAPALLLPLTVSLLFGYMFPDVGHGLLLASVGLLLYQRWPQGRFLLPCGLSSALFGLLFGEVFGLEGVLEPLWIKPMDDPLLLLLPPILFGVGLILLGLVFNGIEAHWRGDLRPWLLRDAPVLLMYSAGCIGLLQPTALWFSGLGLLWFGYGQLRLAGAWRLGPLLAGLLLLLQSLFELAINTVSFVRVGAFALAHAALASAVAQLGAGIDSTLGQLLFYGLGHLLIIAIEGLVVFVQTSRLVLFEFFTRFLKAEGRLLRPLVSPKAGE